MSSREQDCKDLVDLRDAMQARGLDTSEVEDLAVTALTDLMMNNDDGSPRGGPWA